MQDTQSTYPVTQNADATQVTTLARIADSHALLFELVLGTDGLSYVLRDNWTGVIDCGPSSLPEIAIHLGYYEEHRARGNK